MRRLFILMCLSLFICSMDVHAETTNDLFELFGEEPMTGELSVYKDYQKAVKDYNTAKKDIELNESYNAMLEAAEVFNKEKIDELENNIQSLSNVNTALADEIEANIYGPRDNLLSMVKDYKRNVAAINQLLSKRKAYRLSDRKDIDYSKANDLADMASKVESAYVSTVDVQDLGDIKNIKVPLGNGNYEIDSQFGSIVDPLTNEGFTYHTGIDFNAPEGTSVKALFNGVVNTTGYGPVGGYYVSILHGNGVISYYCHLSEIRVKAGDKVQQYDEIALSGKTGDKTIVPHLHLGLYFDANAVDVGILFGGEDSEQ